MVALSLLLACSAGPEEQRIEAEEQVLEAMDQHWDEAEGMREAVVAGDLGRFHQLAASFEKRMPIQGLPADLEPLAAPLAEQVTAAATAADLQQASMVVGRMAAACGGCHTSAKVTPTFDTRLPKSKRKEVPPEMVWHQVAEAKLWAALVRHDEDAFRQGAEELQKAMFRVDDGTELGSELQALEQRVQEARSCRAARRATSR
jgi:cytochrome c553